MQYNKYYEIVYRDTDFEVNYDELIYDINAIETINGPSNNEASVYAKENHSSREFAGWYGDGYKIIGINPGSKFDYYIGNELVYTISHEGRIYISSKDHTKVGSIGLMTPLIFIMFVSFYFLFESIVVKKSNK